jgi:hypothetical protein
VDRRGQIVRVRFEFQGEPQRFGRRRPGSAQRRRSSDSRDDCRRARTEADTERDFVLDGDARARKPLPCARGIVLHGLYDQVSVIQRNLRRVRPAIADRERAAGILRPARGGFTPGGGRNAQMKTQRDAGAIEGAAEIGSGRRNNY